MSNFIVPPSLNFIDLPEGINNPRHKGLTKGEKILICRTYGDKKHVKYINYKERVEKIFGEIYDPKLGEYDSKTAIEKINKLCDEIITEAMEILNGFDKKIEKEIEDDLGTGKFYVSKNNGKIDGVEVFFEDEEDVSPSEFRISFRKPGEMESEKFTIQIFRVGFDKAFELAMEQICKFRGIKLTSEIKETFLKTKVKYSKRSDILSA